MIDLRLELANVLFEGGEYRRAAPAYQRLAADLVGTDGPDTERVFRCRLQEATCHALLVQTSLALRPLGDLFDDEQRVFGKDDPRTMALRRQIGLLQRGAGQRDAAERTLADLLADSTQLHGPEHPTAVQARDLLANLRDRRG